MVPVMGTLQSVHAHLYKVNLKALFFRIFVSEVLNIGIYYLR